MIRYLDPSALAGFQDETMELSDPGPADARARIAELNRFGLLFQSVLGLSALPKNNLYIRQHLLLSALHHAAGESAKEADARSEALKAFDACLFEGPSLDGTKGMFYAEGYSYFLYVEDAFRFHERITGENPVPDLRAAVERSFALLAAPDGRVPAADTRFTDRVRPVAREGFGFFPGYTVFRRRPDIFLLIAHNPRIMDFRRNLHVDFDFGHFCLYGRGAWRILHEWYEGYDRKRAGPGKEPWARNVIVGAFNREPAWRYLPTAGLRVRETTRNRVRLGIGRAERIFTFRDDGFEVLDRGGDFSSLNLEHGLAGGGGDSSRPAVRMEALRYDKFNRDLSDPRIARCRLYGKERSVFVHYGI